MKRKLSLLIIILMDRSLIFLDEVTSGVDPISRIQIRQVIDALKDQGKTIVFTSHDLEEIEKVADWVTMIKEGQIVFTKRIQDLKGERLENIFIEEGLK
ncbi:AAA family ATPase [Facklamia hominis]|uniref:AAA family ATPase n=1 Tax=Facklamia hominis TaxID=178214 RepID=UPI0029D41DDF|nr:AAA family ATPase [Facklamia hominis]WPJ90571.1 AAA family ATPase [Facklamia hominis]